jgi:hypothetical protein
MRDALLEIRDDCSTFATIVENSRRSFDRARHIDDDRRRNVDDPTEGGRLF